MSPEPSSSTPTPTGFDCAGAVPTAALLTDFSNWDPDAGDDGNWGVEGTDPVWGGAFVYPSAAENLTRTVDATAMSFNTMGMVSDYSGFGLWFGPCTDASTFEGIAFTISGNAGESGMLNFRVQRNATTAIDEPNMKGACVFETNQFSECVHPNFNIPVTDTPTEVMVAWSDLMGGMSDGAATDAGGGADIVGLEWAFSWSGATDTPYAVDVTLTNVRLLGDAPPPMGSAGSGGGGMPGEGGAAGEMAGGAGGAMGGAGGAMGGSGGMGSGVTYEEVHAIFTAKCVPCHNGDPNMSGMRTHGQADIEASFMDATKMTGDNSPQEIADRVSAGEMPPGTAPNGPLEQAEIDLIVEWVNAGAPR